MSRIQLSFGMKEDFGIHRPSISLRTTNEAGEQQPGYNIGTVLKNGRSKETLTEKERVEFHADISKKNSGLSLVFNTVSCSDLSTFSLQSSRLWLRHKTQHLPHVNWNSDQAMAALASTAKRTSLFLYKSLIFLSLSPLAILTPNLWHHIQYRHPSTSISQERFKHQHQTNTTPPPFKRAVLFLFYFQA